MQALKTLEG